jgi:dTDP-4-dehydrorhamnose reductase
MNILVTGSHGMLARDVCRLLRPAHLVHERDIHDLDICNASLVREEINALRPDVVVNCAAYTNVDACEADAEAAMAVNADGVRNLAEACSAAGCLLCHISTDFVFDGKKNAPYVEEDSTNPLSVYGESKRAGERHIQVHADQHLIIRTSWMFGAGGANFVRAILNRAAELAEFGVVNDQRGCPTYSADLAVAISQLMEVNARGIFHVCNAGACSWFEFAEEILRLSGSSSRVLPIPAAQLNRPAARPSYSVMDCGKFTRQTGHAMRHWKEALREFLRSELKQGKCLK